MTPGRADRHLVPGWPEAIELFVLALRAGSVPIHAVDAVVDHASSPIAEAFGEVAHRLQRGQRLADAVVALPEHLGPEASELADSIAAADRYGHPLGPVLDRLGDDARAGRRRRAEIAARALPVRLSFPLVVCTLPSFVLLAIVPAVLGAITSLRGSIP